ncbi:MAG: hypothetical protein ACXVXH_17745, partial [Nocardioidaceae bacterium]
MRLPRNGAVTGWASLRLHRANFFDGLARDGTTRKPVPLITGPSQGRRRHDGVLWSQDSLDPAEVRVRHGIRHTTVERALFDEMRVADNLREAVVSIDMAAAAGLTTILRMQRYVAGHAGRAGAPVVRRALVLADEMSRSPNETRMRLIWVLDARLPAPRCNIEVFDADGSFIGVADLLDEQGGVVGEFDGADHRGARRHARDVAREEGRFGIDVEA